VRDMDMFKQVVWDWFLHDVEAWVLTTGYMADDDYYAGEHLRSCGVDIAKSGLPEFGSFTMWGGTFTGNETLRGVVAEHVSCKCGQVSDRSVGRDEVYSLSDIIQKVIARAEKPGTEGGTR
jgi:hypothetical protein